MFRCAATPPRRRNTETAGILPGSHALRDQISRTPRRSSSAKFPIDRPVIDRTGLTKRYVIRLVPKHIRVDPSGERQYYPDLASDLQSQLGPARPPPRRRSCTSARYTVEHVEEPSPN